MDFAQNAIGFYLQLSDTLTPALSTAEKAYKKFTINLDKFNIAANDSAQGAFSKLTQLVEQFQKLPAEASRAYDKARRTLKDRMRPLTQRVNLEFSAKLTESIGAAIATGVAKLFRQAKFRMSATMPLKRSPFFDNKSMRSAYKNETQPPDYRGWFQNIPKYARGGPVLPSGTPPPVPAPPGPDTVLAWLTPGELVLPKKLATVLQDADTGKIVSPADMKNLIAEIANRATAISKVQSYIAQGFGGTKAIEDLNKMLQDQGDAIKNAQILATGYKQKGVMPLIDAVSKAQAQMGAYTKSVEKATGAMGILQKLLSPTKFLAINKALSTLQSVVHPTSAALKELGGATGTDIDAMQSYSQHLYDAGVVLGKSRTEMRVLGKETLRTAKAMGLGTVGADNISGSLEAVATAGFRVNTEMERETAKKYAAGIAGLERVTGDSKSSLAEMSMAMARMDFSPEALTAYTLSLKGMSEVGNISFSKLQDTVQTAIPKIQTFLDSNNPLASSFASPAARKQLMEGVGSLATGMNAVWSDAAPEMMDKVTAALADPRKIKEVQMLFGASADTVMSMLGKGPEGAAQAMTMLQGQIKKFGTTSPGIIAEILDISPETVTRLAKAGGDATDVMLQTRGSIVALADGTATLSKRLLEQQGTWEKVKGTISTFVNEHAAWLMEAMDDISLSAIHSGVFIVKELGGALLKVGVQAAKTGVALVGTGSQLIGKFSDGGNAVGRFGDKLMGWIKPAAKAKDALAGVSSVASNSTGAIAQAATVAGQTTAATTGAIAQNAMTMGQRMADIGKGIGGFISGIVKGIADAIGAIIKVVSNGLGQLGKGIGNFVQYVSEGIGKGLGALGTGIGNAVGGIVRGALGGLGEGLKLLAPGLEALGKAMMTGYGAAGLGALILLVVAFAAALRIAAPGIEALTPIITAAIGGVVAMFSIFAAMDIGKMLAIGPAIGFAGIGLAALAAGLYVLTPALVLAAPALLIFGAAIAVMNEMTGTTGGMTGPLTGIVAAFGEMDVAAIEQVTNVLVGLSAMLLAFAGMSAIVAVIAAGAVGGKAVGWIVSLFGGGSPMEILSEQAQGIASTVGGIVKAFINLSPDDVEKAVGGMAATVGILSSFVRIQGIAQVVTQFAVVNGMFDLMAKALGKGSVAELVAAQAQGIVATVKSIVDAFSELKPDVIEQASGVFGAIGDMLVGYEKIAAKMQDLTGGTATRIFEAISNWLTGDPLKKLAEKAQGVAGVVATIVGAFAPMAAQLDLMPKAMDSAVATISGYAKVAQAAAQVDLSQVTDVQRKLAIQPLSPAELQAVVTVQVAGNVSADDQQTHVLLQKIADLLSGGVAAPATPREAAPPVTDATRRIAEGGW